MLFHSFLWTSCFTLISTSLLSSSLPEETVIINMLNESILPRHFRSCRDEIIVHDFTLKPQMTGLSKLHISGSGQFSQNSLQTLIEKLDHPASLLIIDLRQECHGFVNGMAVSWFSPKNWKNVGKSLLQIEKEEKERLNDILNTKVPLYKIESKNLLDGSIEKKQPFITVVKTVATEKEIVEDAKAHYMRIPITDHKRPSDLEVDRFLLLVRDLPKETKIHFHCSAGDGRTTTMMCLYDMIKNSKEVSFEDIINRQWLLGGSLLSKLPDPSHWKYQAAQERFLFLKEFYNYTKSNANGFQSLWSSYSSSSIKEKAS